MGRTLLLSAFAIALVAGCASAQADMSFAARREALLDAAVRCVHEKAALFEASGEPARDVALAVEAACRPQSEALRDLPGFQLTQAQIREWRQRDLDRAAAEVVRIRTARALKP